MAGINITLGGNFAKLDELKSKARTTADSVKGSFASVGKNIASNITGTATAAIAAGFAGIVVSIKSAISAGGDLNDMMAQTGASGKGLLIMGRAFENVGLSASDVGGALNRMQKALAGVNEEGEPTNQAFKKLGLSVADLSRMDPVAAFQKISESISSIHSPATRTAIAMEIFGKAGGKMLRVVTDASAFSAAAEALGSLADVLPGMAADADFVGDSVAGLDDNMKQLGAGIAKELMPELLTIAKAMNDADFVGLGKDIGVATRETAAFVSYLAKAVELLSYMPMLPIRGIAKAAGSMDPTEGEALPMIPGASVGADGMVELAPAATPPEPATKGRNQASDVKWVPAKYEGTSLADAIKRAQVEEKAAAKKAEAEAKTKAIAADEYKLEAAMLQARLTGDDKRLAKLEREKAIRAEMAKLTGAGWDAATAREQSGKMVDARAAADSADKNRQDGMQSNAGSLGAFAQSMNVLFGRSANSGLIEENKRQTKLLSDIRDGLRKVPPPVKLEIVPTF